MIKPDTTQSIRTMDTKTNKYCIIQQMPEGIITHEEIMRIYIHTHTINSTHNWKAPGKDKIANIWLKQFTSTHLHLIKLFNSYITHPHAIPHSHNE